MVREMERMRSFAERDDGVRLATKIVAEGLHFGEGMLVAGPVGSGYAGVEAFQGLGGAVELGKGLGGHLIGRNVVGVVLDEGVELGECVVSVALGDVLHGQAVAGEGVDGVGCEDFGEGGDFSVGVHELMVRFGGWDWQVC